ncbi:MAG: adenylate kinase family protein [Salinarchaeum sp.]
MRVAVTGTPGTGKTTAVECLEDDASLGVDLPVVHLNEVLETEGFHTGRDPDRDSLVADIDAITEYLADYDDLLVESHLAHHLPVDRVVVLRCHPEVLSKRLRERGESPMTAEENAESEALDVILSEAVKEHGASNVYEIETTDRSPTAIAAAIAAVIAGEREPAVGAVSYIEYLT